MTTKQKLELTWIDKEKQPRLEPRILIEDKDKSYGDPNTGNMLIHGDNLLALKALEQDFAGKIKCIYIDPPFNTGQAFEYYDDSIEHSIWLTLMRDRFVILYKLLSKDGLFWIHLDDSEVHYCKVMLDEIFMRHNFITHITYERSGPAGLGQGGFIVDTAEHILLYKKELLPKNEIMAAFDIDLKTMKRYKKALINKGEKELIKEFNAKSNGEPVKIYKHINFKFHSISLSNYDEREREIKNEFKKYFEFLFRGNQIQKENSFQCEIIKDMDKDSLYSIEYIPSRGKNKNIITTLYYFNCELLGWLKDTAEIKDNKIIKYNNITNVWTHSEIPKADIANEGDVKFSRGKKPEQLLKRIIELSSKEGDWILDSFLGSGSTAAVANKLKRKWIGIELGDHCLSHCLPRLKKVINGTDQLGISKIVNWRGGGGFKYYELAPSLLKQDKYGNWIITENYNADMLAAAMAKHEGFKYHPDQAVFWKQGRSTEKDFIFTTTQFVTVEMLDQIHDDMQPDESLLIACKAFHEGCTHRHININIRKIPNMLLGRCEFGREDYSLNIINMPRDPDEPEFVPPGPGVEAKSRKELENQGNLFEE